MNSRSEASAKKSSSSDELSQEPISDLEQSHLETPILPQLNYYQSQRNVRMQSQDPRRSEVNAVQHSDSMKNLDFSGNNRHSSFAEVMQTVERKGPQFIELQKDNKKLLKSVFISHLEQPQLFTNQSSSSNSTNLINPMDISTMTFGAPGMCVDFGGPSSGTFRLPSETQQNDVVRQNSNKPSSTQSLLNGKVALTSNSSDFKNDFQAQEILIEVPQAEIHSTFSNEIASQIGLKAPLELQAPGKEIRVSPIHIDITGIKESIEKFNEQCGYDQATPPFSHVALNKSRANSSSLMIQPQKSDEDLIRSRYESSVSHDKQSEASQISPTQTKRQSGSQALLIPQLNAVDPDQVQEQVQQNQQKLPVFFDQDEGYAPEIKIENEFLQTIDLNSFPPIAVSQIDIFPRILNPKPSTTNAELQLEQQDTVQSLPQPEMAGVMVNRMMEVKELNLRGLSSSDEDTEEERKPQQRVRKPFNSFKEDDTPFLFGRHHSNVILSPRNKNKKGATKGDKNDEYFHPPVMEHHISQSNSLIKPKMNDMTGMHQRYQQFNTHMQAMNHIEQLTRQNSHLQKMLMSSQHDLRLLQRFTKNYFKSLEHFDLKDITQNDQAMQSVLRKCFQDTPVMLLAFSSPLIRRVEDETTHKTQLSEMPLLDFDKEFQGAIQGMGETRNAIKIGKVQATVEKLFRFCIDRNPVGMHFSGHGVVNENSMNGANCLVLETDDGCAHYLSEDQLKKLINDLNTPLKFVFLASCHSEFAGILFHFAGVEHVICVKQNEEIYDQAAITMAKNFYHFLFSEHNTVCKAFERAKLFLSSHPDKKISRETPKFIMIKENDDISDRIPKSFFDSQSLGVGKLRNYPKYSKLHQCKILGPFQQGEVEMMNEKPQFPYEAPPLTGEIIGRQIDTQAVIELFKQKTPIVLIHGLVGIGKSAVAKRVGIYLSQREVYRDGVIYFSMRDRDFINYLNFKMFAFIFKNKNNTDLEEPLLQPQNSIRSGNSDPVVEKPENEALLEGDNALPKLTEDFNKIVDQTKFQRIQAILKNKECLIIIDNAEQLLQNDQDQTCKFFESLLTSCPHLQFLFTSTGKHLSKIAGVAFYHLEPISNHHSLELLQKFSGHVITPHEVTELLHKTATKREKGRVTRLEDHNLCTMLSGHPGSIMLLAPLFKNRSPLEFYKLLLKMIEEPGLLRDVSQISSENSLQISLIAMTSHLKRENPMALQLLSLVGLMPKGIYERDLNKIWGSDKWFVLAEILVQMSLLQFVVETKQNQYNGQRQFRLMQFMNKFAASLLDRPKLQEFHDRICQMLLKKMTTFYNQCCVETYRDKQMAHQIDVLDEEPNVWACINTIFELAHSVEDHLSKQDSKNRVKRRFINFGAGYEGFSGTEMEHDLSQLKGGVDYTDLTDTCDENATKFDKQSLVGARMHASNISISQISTQQVPINGFPQTSPSNHFEAQKQTTDATKIKVPRNKLPRGEKQAQSPIGTSVLRYKHNPAQIADPRCNNRNVEKWEGLELPQNLHIEKRVSLQLAHIAREQKKMEASRLSPLSFAKVDSFEKVEEPSFDSLRVERDQPDDCELDSFEYSLPKDVSNETPLEAWTVSNHSNSPAMIFDQESLNDITFATQPKPNPQCDMDYTGEISPDIPESRHPSQTTFGQNFLDDLQRHNLKSEHTNLEVSDELLQFDQFGSASLAGDMAEIIEHNASSTVPPVPQQTAKQESLMSLPSMKEEHSLKKTSTLTEESYNGALTNDQSLIVIYISLLIMQQRSPFALRAIYTIDQQIKSKLVCHANMTKLYGMAVLISKNRVKDAFYLFRLAKKIFKKVGGEDNSCNMGIAQCYMIEANLLRTKSDQLFDAKQPDNVVLKKSLKRFEVAKKIYRERQHLAGQLYCCQELMHVYKALKLKQLSLQNELKELHARLSGAYTQDCKLYCGEHIFISRSEGLEFSLMIEIIDHNMIVSQKPRRDNVRLYNKQIKNDAKLPPKRTTALTKSGGSSAGDEKSRYKKVGKSKVTQQQDKSGEVQKARMDNRKQLNKETSDELSPLEERPARGRQYATEKARKDTLQKKTEQKEEPGREAQADEQKTNEFYKQAQDNE